VPVTLVALCMKWSAALASPSEPAAAAVVEVEAEALDERGELSEKRERKFLSASGGGGGGGGGGSLNSSADFGIG